MNAGLNYVGFMNLSPSASSQPAIWNALRQAISESSGFQEWLQSQSGSSTFDLEALDVLVHDYLEETLSALAY
ncbi:MAG: hypothetical protein AAFY57_00480 [Cyanobacteria bacterium J06642_2]